MFLHRTKDWWDKAIARAERTVAETLVVTMPASIAVTPTMVHEANCEYLVIIFCWLATGILGGLSSILLAYAKGMPEADD